RHQAGGAHGARPPAHGRGIPDLRRQPAAWDVRRQTGRSRRLCSAGHAAGGESALPWMKNQYREALDRARREGKLVLLNFTGYACTNCHWMKANMFTRPEIAAAMKNFVLVDLYTDGTDAESEANQKVQLAKFHTVAIPYYAILDADGNSVATYPGVTRDAGAYLAF